MDYVPRVGPSVFLLSVAAAILMIFSVAINRKNVEVERARTYCLDLEWLRVGLACLTGRCVYSNLLRMRAGFAFFPVDGFFRQPHGPL